MFGCLVVVCLQMFAELHCTQVNIITLHCEHQVHFKWCGVWLSSVGQTTGRGSHVSGNRHSYVVPACIANTQIHKYTSIQIHKYRSVTIMGCGDVHWKYTNTEASLLRGAAMCIANTLGHCNTLSCIVLFQFQFQGVVVKQNIPQTFY